MLDIPLNFPPDLESEATSEALRSVKKGHCPILENLHPLILLDGLDEVSHKAKRDSVLAACVGWQSSLKKHESSSLRGLMNSLLTSRR